MACPCVWISDFYFLHAFKAFAVHSPWVLSCNNGEAALGVFLLSTEVGWQLARPLEKLIKAVNHKMRCIHTLEI